MVERKLFKTKLCVLYQKGHCSRQSCSFAHGHAELRRFSASFNGRRDYRGSDLRDKLDKRRSPLRRYSPRRDARGRQASRGYSPGNSIGKRRKQRKKQHLDGQSDRSGSVKFSDCTGNQTRDKKLVSSDSKSIFGEQLKQVRSEINALNDHKCQLEAYLEERVEEVGSLTSRIQDLEVQLSQEREECKRITSKIKKFVTAHKRYSRLQDEVKRSHDQLQKLGDQLSSDVSRLGANEDFSINILSDGETIGNHTMSSLNQLQKNTSLNKKRPRMVDATEESKSANLMNGGGGLIETIRLDKRSRWNGQHAHFDDSKEADGVDYGSDSHRSLLNGNRPNKEKFAFSNVASGEKLKGYEAGAGLPPTSMAAHAIDDVLETVEVEENHEVIERTSKGYEGARNGMPTLPFALPLPPPVPQNAYAQYQGEDENVDVDDLEEEMADVDIV